MKISTKPCRPSFPSSPPALSTAPCCFWKNSTGCPCVLKKQHPPHPHSQSLQPRRTFLTYSHTGSVFLLCRTGAEADSRLGPIDPVSLTSSSLVAFFNFFTLTVSYWSQTGVSLDVSIKTSLIRQAEQMRRKSWNLFCGKQQGFCLRLKSESDMQSA